MLRLSLLTVAAMLLGIALGPARPSAAANPYVMEIDMYGPQVVPAVNSTGWGFVRFFFSQDRLSADYTVDVKGFSNNLVTGADIRRGTPGTNGPVVRHLADGGFIVMGSRTTFTATELNEMASGQWYVTLYTTFHPNGEMRGQIVLPPDFAPAPSAAAAPVVVVPNLVPAPEPLQPQASLPAPLVALPAAPAAAVQPAAAEAAAPANAPLFISPPNTGDGGLRAQTP